MVARSGGSGVDTQGYITGTAIWEKEDEISVPGENTGAWSNRVGGSGTGKNAGAWASSNCGTGKNCMARVLSVGGTGTCVQGTSGGLLQRLGFLKIG